MRKRRNKRKTFSPVERARYHKDRTMNPAKYGIKLNSAKDMYSMGFEDAVYNINNRSAVKNEFGAKKANSYNLGHKAGKRCVKTYAEKTGRCNLYLEL